MQKGSNSTYFGNIKEGIRTSIKGLRLSMRHFKNARKKANSLNVNDKDYFSQNVGTVTLQYPNEVISVPDIGRYRLYNEMDDCIVCDKCAKVCPVDCIDIEPIKSSELIGNASDGSPIRLYAAKFDIDMAKCCFCGLCTTVCPTECLTMTKAYDFAEFDVKDFNYHYANISPDQADEKRKNYEQFLLEKEALKLAKLVESEAKEDKIEGTKPVFRPNFKRPEANSEENIKVIESSPVRGENKPKSTFRPVFKKPDENIVVETSNEEVAQKPQPVFRPTFKKPEISENNKNLEPNNEVIKVAEQPKPRPVFRPAVKKPKEE